ncbi:MAG: hypothetical protein ACTHJW_04735 [Streptosporangiaceae bacterium]
MPVKVLRSLFSGIGQLLLAADRMRVEEAQSMDAGQEERDAPPASPAGAPASAGRTFRSPDSTGNVRLLAPDVPADSEGEASGAGAATSSAGHKPAAAADLPVPGYDGLSLASLRARLRNLDTRQLRMLLEYERSVANRADIVTMFERRIAKIESGPDAS